MDRKVKVTILVGVHEAEREECLDDCWDGKE